METSAKFKIGFFHGVRNCALCIVHRALPFQGAAASRAGMALVVVLGLISLLLVSSVTFAIMMRVERASSANARNTIMARQAAKSALAYAIRDIDHYLETSPTNEPLWRRSSNPNSPSWETSSHPDWTFRKENSAATARKVTFWKDTFGSIDHSINNQTEENRAIARVMGHQLQDYLPFAIRHRAYAQSLGKYSGENPIAPEWVPMTIVKEDDKEAGEYDYDVVGRCAYLALNTSGYLEIPSLCREGKQATRRYGASPAEIQPVGEFLKKGEGDDLKEDNKGMDYETVAEIIRAKANKNANPKDNKLNATVFADGAAFSAFNFAPVGRMPTNLPGTDAEFNDRLCIAGDGSDHHIECLRKHKAAIIAAFKRAGLTQSSDGFANLGPKMNMVDDSCDGTVNGKPCTVCHGTKDNPTPAFTLQNSNLKNLDGDAVGISEQALWAYLGLIDYIDDDNEPFYDNDIDMDYDLQQFARPVTENTPLFNGFIATLKFFREETYTTEMVDIGTEDNPQRLSVNVFCGSNVTYGVEFNGKVVFANRNAALSSEAVFDDIENCDVEAKMGFNLGGSPWDDDEYKDLFVESAKNYEFSKDLDSVKFDEDSEPYNYIFKSQKRVFGSDPVCFIPKTEAGKRNPRISAKIHLDKPISADKTEEEKEEIFKDNFGNDFPELIYVGAAGSAYDGNALIHRVPAMGEGHFNDNYVENWLSSCFESDNGHSFKNGLVESVKDKDDNEVDVKVWRTKEEAEEKLRVSSDATPNYTLKRKVVNIVMWAEMIDPAFSCASAAETLTGVDQDQDVSRPRSAAPSHNRSNVPKSKWLKFVTSNPNAAEADSMKRFRNFKGKDERDKVWVDAEKFFDDIEKIDNPGDSDANDLFDDRVFKFQDDPNYCLGYFISNFDAENEEGGDRYPGYSIFQRFFLTDDEEGNDKTFVKEFPGVRDGTYRTKDGIHVDNFFAQFNSLHVRNNGLDSVGELGYLPIGPYATIRLFGFSGEGGHWGLGDVNKDISMFNAVPYREDSNLYNRPFHRVLDYFSATNRPMRGLININGGDRLAIASVFNGTRLDDFLYEDIEDGDDEATIDEDNARDLFTLAAVDAFSGHKKSSGGSFGHLSDIGWLYDTDDNDLHEDMDKFFDDLADNADDPQLDSNNAREAVIRNTCGLFTDRGLNFSILLRGEAFTPFLGRSDVRSEKGTTLASRSAFAQLWRDTEPDEDGNYPYFIQYFKIFDE